MANCKKQKIGINQKIGAMHRTFYVLLASMAMILLSGCAAMTRPHAIADDPAFAPVTPERLVPPAPANGAIYQVDRGYSLYTDRVAHNVGDILTVVLEEKTQSTKSSATKYVKDSETEFNQASVLGQTVTSGGMNFSTDVNFERDFSGSADSDQSNSLSGNITVTVSEVFPNGLLRIRGEKWLTLNQGDEYIRLSGLIRAEDISDSNTVPSSKIADARIAYGATGDFDQANRMGWASKVFNSEWWPF